MRHLFVMLIVGLLGFGLAVDDADARRFGGGKSFGTQSRSAEQPASQTAVNRNAQTRPAGTSRMGGMLGGMLAGGLLAALFFGGAFDELRLVDILLIAGVAFLLFRLLARRSAVAAGSTPAGRPQAFQTDASGMTSDAAFATEPDWFDRERFLSGAKEHFMTLQRAWDNHDLSGIQEYVTPELYNLLREERANQPANNRTEIIRLFAELGNVREVAQRAEATVIFHGILDENGEENEFNETWHLIRDLRDGAPWYLQGIEQNSTNA
ncbi:Tim44 domain-containing protein [Halomonas sp. TRM85114]|uniref:Tim44 domain-containing protein n=1 Tax=Halomonas jincaotanensis TaxID=2810616 RepID=UPI001BD4D75B|nr:Tim44-like domain-containing protein [Halomonas jincaotanensis]MBS9403002.1 Tim44 domain-containing protein [Halomonas jincaotanensis]